MALAMTHFAFGAAATILVVELSGLRVRYRLTWIVVGGVWALLPDLHWIAPVYSDALRQFHRSSRLVDLFWLHRTLDQQTPRGPVGARYVAAVALVFFVATVAFAEFRTYRRDRCHR